MGGKAEEKCRSYAEQNCQEPAPKGTVRRRGRNRLGNLGQEAVAAARDRFNEAWTLGGVAQGFAKPADGVVEAVFELDERILGPEPLLKLLPGDDLAGMLEESEQNLQRLLVEFDAHALLAQLPRRRIHFER